MPDLYLHNTLTRQKEKFEPLEPSHVRMYVCGPTVYDFAHIGNAVPVVAFDILYRLLKRLYPRVTYVRNITDVEDKIMDRARENGEPIERLTARTAAAYQADMGALGVLPPDIEPRATDYIPGMIAMIETLIGKGFAYVSANEAPGHVLFDVGRMAEYGRLSRLPKDELIAGARVDVAPYKRNAEDFILWKPSTPDQIGWDSPWGRGRPGWHIECSVMAKAHLGDMFDIHGGGNDLIFPHHENEIAQSCCANSTPFMAKYWLHNGMLTVERKKMAKSLGNFHTVRELLAQYPGEALRLALLSSHYRQPGDFSFDLLQRCKDTLDRLYRSLAVAGDHGADDGGVMTALLNDLNTPQALAALHDCKAEGLKAAGELLGLLQQSPQHWFAWRPASAAQGPSDSEIISLIESRTEARKQKNFAESDRIRKLLSDQGVVLEDGPSGTSWRRA